MYVAVCILVVGLVKVPVILNKPVPEAPPVSPPVTTGAAQVYAVISGAGGTKVLAFGTPLIGVALNNVPLQTSKS